jgi:hypothetical protein
MVVEMPFKSKVQRRKFYAMMDEGKMSEKVVAEYEKESKGKRLPEKVKAKKKKNTKMKKEGKK